MRWIAIAGIVAACHNPAALTAELSGTVLRGPVTPVCQVDVPCDAPFSATFEVRREGRRVATFQSDTQGRFTVRLAPGSYVIVPAADAPLMNPSAQQKTVEVAAEGTTAVQLLFDTGIR
jgi:hypothetical protein